MVSENNNELQQVIVYQRQRFGFLGSTNAIVTISTTHAVRSNRILDIVPGRGGNVHNICPKWWTSNSKSRAFNFAWQNMIGRSWRQCIATSWMPYP